MLNTSFLGLIITIILCLGFLGLIIYFGMKAQFVKVSTGEKGMIGEIGKTTSRVDDNGGWIFIHGENWRAFSRKPIKKGQKVIVSETKRLYLIVEPYEGEEEV
jgi:membrane-bound serine protease (ClpP class)